MSSEDTSIDYYDINHASDDEKHVFGNYFLLNMAAIHWSTPDAQNLFPISSAETEFHILSFTGPDTSSHKESLATMDH